MIQVLVMANDSLLAEVVEWTLAQEINLEVRRLTAAESGHGDQVIPEHRAQAIIVAEELSDDELITASDLLRDDGRLLVITISPKKHPFMICESCPRPISRSSLAVNLARAFSRI